MNDNSKLSNIPSNQLNRVVQLVAYSIIAALVGIIFTAIVLLTGLVLHA